MSKQEVALIKSKLKVAFQLNQKINPPMKDSYSDTIHHMYSFRQPHATVESTTDNILLSNQKSDSLAQTRFTTPSTHDIAHSK